MARIRTIKPEFWQHEDLSGLAPETHMLAAALLNHADDEGYFNANPRLVQSQCLPLRDDSTSIRRSLDDLSTVGFIRLFEGVDGKQYGHIVKFLDHQRIDRPSASKIKGLEDSTNDRRGLDEDSTPEGKGKEQGKEQGTGKVKGASADPPKSKRKSQFTPPTLDQVRDYCRDRENGVDPERFMNHYTANGWMVGKNKMRDWQAAVRNWEKNNQGQANASNQRSGQQGGRAKRVADTLDDIIRNGLEPDANAMGRGTVPQVSGSLRPPLDVGNRGH